MTSKYHWPQSTAIYGRVARSYMEHVYIWAKNLVWCHWRLAAFAWDWVLVMRQWSCTILILNPSRKIVAWEEYKYSILLQAVVWWTLSISMCNALTGVVLLFQSFCEPLLLLENGALPGLLSNSRYLKVVPLYHIPWPRKAAILCR